MYLRKATKQLDDANFYKEHQGDHTLETSAEITTFLKHLLHNYQIDETFFKYLTPNTKIRTPVFYLLPKIHKEGIPGRPILSGCGSPTEKLLSYLDHYLRPIVEESASYIKDTTHFLQQIFEIHTSIPPNSWLVTLDVKSLYTNIPQEEGIEACLKAILNYYGDTPPLHTSYIKQMMVFILKHNYFTFNGRFYQQIQGTAMGSPFAPNYANIFMTNIEQHILQITSSLLRRAEQKVVQRHQHCYLF